MSKSPSSDCATRFTSAASRLTPRLILPDLTTMAREVTLLITASSDAERPVVPMTWTRPRWACCGVDQAALGGDGESGDGGTGHGEIEDAVGVGRQRPQIAGQLDAVG